MYILYKQLKGVYVWFIYLCGSLMLGRTLTWGRWIVTMFSPLLSRSPIIVRKNGEQLPSIRRWAVSTESWQTSLMSQNLFLAYISEKPVPIHKKCLGLLVQLHFVIWLSDGAQNQLMELKVSWWSSKSADGAHSQLMELNVSWWSSLPGDGAQCQVMELKVRWLSSKSADGAQCSVDQLIRTVI